MRRALSRTIRAVTILVTIGALVAAGTLLVRHRQAALAAAPRYGLDPVPVRTELTRVGDPEVTRDYLAVVEPARKATLASRLTAVVKEVRVREGDFVETGQMLAILDDQETREAIRGVESQIAQAEAELAANEATVTALRSSMNHLQREARRLEQLLAVDAASEWETETMRDRASDATGQFEAGRHRSQALAHQIASLRHRLAELETRSSYSAITSPYDGVVSIRHVDPGDLAMPGRALLEIEDRAALRLAFDIPQQDVRHVRAGMTLRYAITADDRRQAQITRLHPSLNHARMLRAEAALSEQEAGGLESGTYVPITIILDRLEGITLAPASAVVASPQRESHVFVVREGRLEAIPVQVMAHEGDQVALAGIEAGQEVVVSTFLGWTTLSSNLAVEMLR